MKKPERLPDSIRAIDGFPLFKANAKSLAKRKPVFGYGINDSDYMTQPKVGGKQRQCLIYRTWTDMLRRCYDPKCQAQNPTYIDCPVANDWLRFSVFHDWMLSQNWLGLQLDKDVLVIGNKHYAPDTCLFVTSQVNGLMNDNAASRGEFPIGVSYYKRDRKYVAEVSVDGKRQALGLYLTPQEASTAYRAAKRENIERVASLQSCHLTRDGLLRHAAMLAA